MSTEGKAAKPAATRIYCVTECDSGKQHLVEAPSVAQVVRRITAPRYTAHVPNGKEIATLMRAGVEVLTDEAVA